MIKITVEMLPFGSEMNKYTIAEGEIINIKPSAMSNYSFHFKQSGSAAYKVEARDIKGTLEGFDTSEGILKLLHTALGEAFSQFETHGNISDEKFLYVMERINEIFNDPQKEWEDKYDTIFELASWHNIRSWRNYRDYYDPDTSYEEDITAFVNYLNQIKNDYLEELKTK